MKITKQDNQNMIAALRVKLGLPTEQFSVRPITLVDGTTIGVKQNPGWLYMENNGNLWKLEKVLETGGVVLLTPCLLTTREMYIFLQGMFESIHILEKQHAKIVQTFAEVLV